MSLQHLTLKPDDLRHSRNIRSSHGIKHMRVHKNEVYYADPDPVIGSEQGGIRPVLVNSEWHRESSIPDYYHCTNHKQKEESRMNWKQLSVTPSSIPARTSVLQALKRSSRNKKTTWRVESRIIKDGGFQNESSRFIIKIRFLKLPNKNRWHSSFCRV